MANTTYLLRPNTFFLLLLRAGKQALGQSTGWAKSNGLTLANLMTELIRVGYPDFSVKDKGTFKTYFSEFKTGRSNKANSKTYFPFAQPVCRAAFMKTKATSQAGALERLEKLCDTYLDLNTGSNKELLAGGLMELLQSSPIDYAFNMGSCEKKPADFASVKDVALYPFLYSVWHYVVMNTPDSTEAKTFNDHIGEATSTRINVSLSYNPEEMQKAASAYPEEETNAAEGNDSKESKEGINTSSVNTDSEYTDAAEVVETVPQPSASTPHITLNFYAPVKEVYPDAKTINKNTYNTYYGVTPEGSNEQRD